MIRVLRAVRPSRRLARASPPRRSGAVKAVSRPCSRTESKARVGDRLADRAPARGVAGRSSRPSSAAEQQGERAAAARKIGFRRRASMLSPSLAHQPAPLEIDQMGEHRAPGAPGAAADRCSRYIASTIAGIRPSPRLELARGSASRASGGGRSAPRTWAVRLLDRRAVGRIDRRGRRGRAADRGSPYRAVMSPSGGETTVVDQPMT